MAVLNINPTRMELTRIKKRLTVAVKGHSLLKDKRDELMRQFLDMVRQTKELRQRIDKCLREIQHNFVLAGALMQREVMRSALMMPKQNVSLDVTLESIMGVNVPVFKTQYKTPNQSDIISYGYTSTNGELDNAVSALSEITPGLIDLARREKTVYLLAAEIEKTRRRVNALENILIPNYQDTIRYITMKLDENERSNLTRLMKVKDMMIEKQILIRQRQSEAHSEGENTL